MHVTEPPRETSHDDDIALLQELADAARHATLRYFRLGDAGLENKDADGGFDPVTRADKEAETAIREILDRKRPEDGVIGEEFPEKRSRSGRVWVLDPIDGTRAFVSGLTNWGVLIALNVDGRAVLGALDQPYIGERFIGRVGPNGEAFLERGDSRRALLSRSCARLEDATLMTTAPELFALGDEAARYQSVAHRVRLKRYGTDCYGYAMVALGAADLVIEAGLKPYDVQAIIPIVEAAGGVITTWDGGRAENGGRILAAGDAALHAAALAQLQA